MGEFKNHALLHIFFEGCKALCHKIEFNVNEVNNMLSSMALVGLYSLRLSFSVVFLFIGVDLGFPKSCCKSVYGFLLKPIHGRI